MRDENKIKELEARGIELTTVREVFDDLKENQVVVNEHGVTVDLNTKIYFHNYGAGHFHIYDEDGKEIFLMVEEKAVFAVSVVEDETRCVWESRELKSYDIALEIFKDECKKSSYEILLYKKINDQWKIIKDRPQKY